MSFRIEVTRASEDKKKRVLRMYGPTVSMA